VYQFPYLLSRKGFRGKKGGGGLKSEKKGSVKERLVKKEIKFVKEGEGRGLLEKV